MTSRITMVIVLTLGLFTTGLNAQGSTDKNSGIIPKPSNMWEFGAHGGYFFVSGDVAQKPGFAGGIHVRKAIDYMFSLRLDLLGGKLKGEKVFSPTEIRNFNTTYFSSTLFGILSLNNFRFDKDIHKTNIYVGVGAGGNYFRAEFLNEETRFPDTLDYEIAPHVTVAAGIAIRISKRVNIGLEHQATLGLSRRADLIDGSEKDDGVRSPFRDIVNYTNIRININIGDKSKNTEPLYWINPLDNIMSNVDDVKKKQNDIALALEDKDNDGVIDAVDKEPNTPPNVPVDTKGRTLDSDKDGIPDYKDREPYYPPRPGEQVNDEGIVINPISAPRPGVQGGVASGGVTEARVRELIGEALQDFQPQSGGGGSVTDWFLPMVHFGSDSYTIKYSDYGNLASIARMLKGNPQLRLVVSGYTDATAPENYNNELSYLRAKSIVDHFVNNHNIGRGRLVLEYKGEAEALVPSASSFMNRRVEFRVAAPSDVEMDPPPLKKKSGY